jgi:hypothetical protein
MTVNATLTVSPASPAHGDTVTATYAVSGNAAQTAEVDGVAHFSGLPDVQVSTTLTLPKAAESFDVPTVAGLTFKATADPHVFTALVP